VDESRQWFKSRHAWDARETPRALSFCAHAMLHSDVFVVPDATKDPRFADNPVVTGDPDIRFYAGAPLVTPGGAALGTFCVLDYEPRDIDVDHAEALRLLGRHVMALLNLRRERNEIADAHRALEAERALRQAEERFGQIVTHIEQAFWMTDPQKAQMVYVSPAYERIWGRSCESLYGNPLQWLNAIHPEDQERIRARLPAQREGAYREEYRIIRPDGSVRWILDQAFPVRDEAEAVSRIVGVAADITERKKLEEELRQSEAGKRAVWESALDAILTMDHEGQVVDLNPAAEDTFGYRREDMVGRSMAELIIPPSLRERHERGLARHRATGEGPILGRRLELPALRRDGRPVRYCGLRRPFQAGEPGGGEAAWLQPGGRAGTAVHRIRPSRGPRTNRGRGRPC
jgi:PAS domain S-box-containing protein